MNDYAQAAVMMVLFIGIIFGVIALAAMAFKVFLFSVITGCVIGIYMIMLSVVRS